MGGDALLAAVLAAAAPAHARAPSFAPPADPVVPISSFPEGGDPMLGVALLDYDGDDDLDVFFANGPDEPAALLRNDGAGHFTRAEHEAGLDLYTGTTGALAVDLTGDGWVDLLLTGTGGQWTTQRTPNLLLVNQGDGTFADHTAGSGLESTTTDVHASAADIDGDGDLDLFVVTTGSVVTHTQAYNKLYRNDGGGTFTDVAELAGVHTNTGACASAFTHLDEDDHVDLLVANCCDIHFAETPFEPYFNLGDGTFEERYRESEIWAQGYWMAVAPGDFDNDGLQDFFSTNAGGRAEPHVLYLNQGDGTWKDVAAEAGIAEGPFGWGAVAADFDDDGNLDLYYAGATKDMQNPTHLERGPGQLYMGRGDGTFEEPTVPFDLLKYHTSGVTQGDLDGDGYPDLLVSSDDVPTWREPGRAMVLRNLGGDNHWLTVHPIDHLPNQAAVGARIRATAGGRTQLREIDAGTSYASTETPWPTFGLAGETEVQVCVRWPDGTGEDFGTFTVDQHVELVHGAGLGPTTCDRFDTRAAGDEAPPPELARDVEALTGAGGCETGAPAGGAAAWGALGLLLLRRRK